MAETNFCDLKKSSNILCLELLDWFLTFLKKGPASPNSPSPNLSRGSPLGLRYHVIDIYLEELINCGSSSLSSEQVSCLNEQSLIYHANYVGRPENTEKSLLNLPWCQQQSACSHDIFTHISYSIKTLVGAFFIFLYLP